MVTITGPRRRDYFKSHLFNGILGAGDGMQPACKIAVLA
jgi:hypothetical protein